MRSTAIPDLVALAMQASDDKIEYAMKILKGEYDMPMPYRPPICEPFKPLSTIAKETGLSRMSLWRWRVPGHKIAGRIHYRTSEVLEYLESAKLQELVEIMRANGWRRPTFAEIKAARGTGESAESGRETPARPSPRLRSARA